MEFVSTIISMFLQLYLQHTPGCSLAGSPTPIPDLFVWTFAGSSSSYTNGVDSNTQFIGSCGVSISQNLNFSLVFDKLNHQIHKIIQSSAEVSLLAGSSSGVWGSTNGVGIETTFNTPNDITISCDNSFALVADSGNDQIRKINLLTRQLSLLSVKLIGGDDVSGVVNVVGRNTQFHNPIDLDISWNGKYVLISDSRNNQIRALVISTREVSTFPDQSSSSFQNAIGTLNFYFLW